MDWWNCLTSLPEPRVMVLQDTDPKSGVGAFVGEIHATIGLALNRAHMIEFAEPVEIDGLKISPGGLIHGDLPWRSR
jgi:hypothetical protein